MKLAVVYNLFDGVELLEHAVAQVRGHVDCVAVHYQQWNWYGQPAPEQIEPILSRLKNHKIIDEYFAFNGNKPPTARDWNQAKSWESQKRTESRRWVANKGFTHYLECDVDEFYVSQEFLEAKELIEYHNYDTTSCDIQSYILSPTLAKVDAEDVKVPFICKLNDKHKAGNFPARVDPTRIAAGVGQSHHHFEPNALIMHHMETIRKNLLLKYESTSRGTFDRGRIKQLVEIINNVKEGSNVDLKGIIQPSKFSIRKTHNLFHIPEFSLQQTHVQ